MALKCENRIYDFGERLGFSRGKREDTDLLSLKKLIPGCICVEKTDITTDKKGIDYIATLRRGSIISIDAKTREKGCSKFWKDGPELAPEIWSVMPGGKYGTRPDNAKAGWTLSESSLVEYIYATFNPEDCDEVFLLPFQLYRIAFRRRLKAWTQNYKVAIQDSGSWESKCVFVPADIVISAISEEMRCTTEGT